LRAQSSSLSAVVPNTAPTAQLISGKPFDSRPQPLTARHWGQRQEATSRGQQGRRSRVGGRPLWSSGRLRGARRERTGSGRRPSRPSSRATAARSLGSYWPGGTAETGRAQLPGVLQQRPDAASTQWPAGAGTLRLVCAAAATVAQTRWLPGAVPATTRQARASGPAGGHRQPLRSHPGGWPGSPRLVPVRRGCSEGRTGMSGGSTFKRCGCRDQRTGRQLGRRCPRLRERGHGSWYLAVEVSAAPDGRRRRVRLGGYATRAAAQEALGRLGKPGGPLRRGAVAPKGQGRGARLDADPGELRPPARLPCRRRGGRHEGRQQL
jgi:hypothetical protein